MTETATLVEPNPALGDAFGTSVAISGNTIVVDAPVHVTGTYPCGDTTCEAQGAAFVFSEPQAGWAGSPHPAAELEPSDGVVEGRFGEQVAINQNTIIVGADNYTTLRQGPLRVSGDELVGHAHAEPGADPRLRADQFAGAVGLDDRRVV